MFSEYYSKEFYQVIPNYLCNDKVNQVVFDTYSANSIKNTTKENQREGKKIKALPKNWKATTSTY